MKDDIKKRLKITEEKPLVKTPLDKKAESTELSKIIKPLEKIVDTGKPVNDNKLILDSDKTSLETLSDILSTPIDKKRPKPNIILADSLSDVDSSRLFSEEKRRRKIELERRDDVKESYKDEIARRKLQKDKIQLMKDEFQLYLKSTYPNIVGDRYIKDSDVSMLQASVSNRKRQIEQSEIQLQKNKVDRLEREKLRKSIESDFEINVLAESEIQTFFENEILLEQKFKIETNPEIENLSYVKQTQKEIKNIEYQMGRPIVPHRDIVESEESDFDINALTNSNDILILTNRDKVTPESLDKQRRLTQLMMELKADDDDEEIYILKN